MKIRKDKLIAFLREVDKELGSDIKLVAVGGTAMTLLGIKPSTVDIDFEGSSEDVETFRKALSIVPHGFRIDIFENGMIFSQQLPGDYSRRSVHVMDFGRIRLYALHPLDIVVTKIGRLDERDMQDIEDCIKKFGLKKEDIKKRAGMVGYAGSEEVYKSNLKIVLERFF